MWLSQTPNRLQILLLGHAKAWCEYAWAHGYSLICSIAVLFVYQHHFCLDRYALVDPYMKNKWQIWHGLVLYTCTYVWNVFEQSVVEFVFTSTRRHLTEEEYMGKTSKDKKLNFVLKYYIDSFLSRSSVPQDMIALEK